jgi:RsiW-degrading membrane proteinase PrsW (M82 family)
MTGVQKAGIFWMLFAIMYTELASFYREYIVNPFPGWLVIITFLVGAGMLLFDTRTVK